MHSYVTSFIRRPIVIIKTILFKPGTIDKLHKLWPHRKVRFESFNKRLDGVYYLLIITRYNAAEARLHVLCSFDKCK